MDTLDPMPFDFQRTEPCELRDYPDWRRGRERYGLWMIPVKDNELLEYIEYCRAALADLLHPTGERQPHLTLFVCGFECDKALLDDDFPNNRLQQQIAALGSVAEPTCRLELDGISSFSSAAYIRVGEHPSLTVWRETLQSVSAEIRQNPYVPHITLGLYRQTIETEALRQRLQGLPSTPSTLQVDELVYATYQASDQLSRLEFQHQVRLDQI